MLEQLMAVRFIPNRALSLPSAPVSSVPPLAPGAALGYAPGGAW